MLYLYVFDPGEPTMPPMYRTVGTLNAVRLVASRSNVDVAGLW